MATFTAAKRGDAVVIAQHHRDYIIGQPGREYDDFQVGVITNITRDGLVKRWRSAWYDGSEGRDIPQRRTGLWVIPAAAFDIPAVIAAARAHHWSGHPAQPKPFGSLDEVRAALKPCRKEAVSHAS